MKTNMQMVNAIAKFALMAGVAAHFGQRFGFSWGMDAFVILWLFHNRN